MNIRPLTSWPQELWHLWKLGFLEKKPGHLGIFCKSMDHYFLEWKCRVAHLPSRNKWSLQSCNYKLQATSLTRRSWMFCFSYFINHPTNYCPLPHHISNQANRYIIRQNQFRLCRLMVRCFKQLCFSGSMYRLEDMFPFTASHFVTHFAERDEFFALTAVYK